MVKKLVVLSALLSIASSAIYAETPAKSKDVVVAGDGILDQILNSIGDSLELPSVDFEMDAIDLEKDIWRYKIDFSVSAAFGGDIVIPFNPTNPKLGASTIKVKGLKVVIEGKNSEPKPPKKGETAPSGLEDFDVVMRFEDDNGAPAGSKLMLAYGKTGDIPLKLDAINIHISLTQENPIGKELPLKQVNKIKISAIMALFKMAPALALDAPDVKIPVPARFDFGLTDGSLVKVKASFNYKKK